MDKHEPIPGTETGFSRSAASRELLNRQSWYMAESEQATRPFIAMSVGSVGPSRAESPEQRVPLGDNMSENYPQMVAPELSGEARSAAAIANANQLVTSLGLEPSHVAVIRPELDYSKPLRTIDVDEVFEIDPSNDSVTWLPERGDLLITRDPEKVLAVRPADCPCMIGCGQTARGEDILFLGHYAWRGENAGFVEQTFAKLDELGIDRDSLRLYVTPGMAAENTDFTHELNPVADSGGDFTHPDRRELFVNVEPVTDEAGATKFHFQIDMARFLHYELKKAGISDYQIFEDTSDTAAPESGYHSHSRAVNHPDAEVNGRDMIVATLRPPQ